MIPVVSSRVTHIGFDDLTQTVYVRFTDGVMWKYYDVSGDTYGDFGAAPSKGRFIAEVLDHFRNGPA